MSGNRQGWRRVILAGILIAVALQPGTGQSPLPLKTPAEECLFARYTQHEEVARFLGLVSSLSRQAVVRVVGWTQETRELPAQEIYLCILTEKGVFSPEGLDRSKPTLLVTASQHGNEQSAKEAALGFIRDLSVGDLNPLLRRANVLVMPQCNPYGNHFDRRQNEEGLDMNRDHVKLESEGAAAIHRVLRAWMPEATLDMHEKGDDFYRVSLGCVSNLNIAAALQDYSRRVILDEVEEALERKRVTFCEYVVRDEMGLNTSTGAAIPREMLRDREMMLRYSTVEVNDGRNGPGIYQTLSFIMECASRHDVATLGERTGWQSLGLRFWAEAVIGHGPDILAMVVRLRQSDQERASTYGPDDRSHLQMSYVRDPAVPQVVRKRFAPAPTPVRGILKVDKKAGETLFAADLTASPYPEGVQVLDETVKNWFPNVTSSLAVPRPLGYIIPGEKTEVVDNLLRHRIAVALFTREVSLPVEAYVVSDIEPSRIDWLPPQRIAVDKKSMTTLARKGDFYVSCAQPAASLIPLLLEPQSQFGLICYQRFRLVPKKEEVFPIVRDVQGGSLPLVPYKDFR